MTNAKSANPPAAAAIAAATLAATARPAGLVGTTAAKPDSLEAITQKLVDEVVGVTKQTAQDVAKFAALYAPRFARSAATARLAGTDQARGQADRMLRHLRAQAIAEGAVQGLALQAEQLRAFNDALGRVAAFALTAAVAAL